jgi:hypothetical protein
MQLLVMGIGIGLFKSLLVVVHTLPRARAKWKVMDLGFVCGF